MKKIEHVIVKKFDLVKFLIINLMCVVLFGWFATCSGIILYSVLSITNLASNTILIISSVVSGMIFMGFYNWSESLNIHEEGYKMQTIEHKIKGEIKCHKKN